MHQWYYSKNGTQLGPVAQGELLAKLSSGEVAQSDLVWKEGMADWLPASQVAELKVLASASPPAHGGASAQAPVSPYAAPAVTTYGNEPVIPNYLWQSIVVTLLCGLLGVPAIVYAAKVDGLKARGDIQGAMSASSSAKMWCWIAFGVSFGIGLLIFLFGVIGVAAGG